MAFSRRFAPRLAWRTAVLVGAVGATAVLATWGRAPIATLLAGLGIVAAIAWLWSLVNQGNADLARFVTALDHGDLTQSFPKTARGAHFDQLGVAYDRALTRLREERGAQASAARFVEAVADSSPVPLLVLHPDNSATLANRAARTLLGRGGEMTAAALAAFDRGFAADLAAAVPGTSRLSRLGRDGVSQRVSLDTTLMETEGSARRIVAVRVVQSELDRAELAAQVDLVRVLTHEIMNSLTPVVSLSATADRLISGLDPTLAPGIADVQLAAGALARRAAELERFVESYKGFSAAPALRREPIPTARWLDDVVRLFRATPLAATVEVTASMAPDLPAIDGDRALLTQVLLNLLKNAAEAVGDADGTVGIEAMRVGGDRVRISILDSGAGIPPSLRDEVFLPFFTTKKSGTGIGLSLARQIVLLHGGQIGVADAVPSRIDLVLPATG